FQARRRSAKKYQREREGFSDLTWPFIRGALNLVDMPSHAFEIPVKVEKECVAMSGIVNARMDDARQVLGEETLEIIKTQCSQPNISEPSQELQTIMTPLREAFEAGGLYEDTIQRDE
ncbi:hypothetical protein BGZ94_002110, partial [Podila epigama]